MSHLLQPVVDDHQDDSWDQNASVSRNLAKDGLEGGFRAHTCSGREASPPNLSAFDCVRIHMTPNITTFELSRCNQPNQPNSLSHLECASTPNAMTETLIKPNSYHPNASINYSVLEAFTGPHSCQPNPTSECVGCMSTPNSKTCGPVSFKKLGCHSHVSTSTPSCRCQINRADIVAELNALQERCSSLKFAVAQSSLTTPHLQDGFALPSPRAIDNGAAMPMNRSDCGLSSGASPILTGPEIWGVSFAGDLRTNFMDQTSQNAFGHALPVLGSEAPVLNQEAPAEDHPQLDAFLDGNIDTEFPDIFDFNAASLPLPLDVHGITNSIAESATKDVSNILPTLPTISQPKFDLTVVAPVASGTDTRHRCQHCGRTFSRSSDRDRHALKHDPNAPRYACFFPGCDKVGKRGFLRRDNLTQHQAHMRH
ncbi:hypothetical protein B0O99DRAFT_737670 [Bisporella sp. PMI_857]|nr:hypothetical protein B0O99DRAFT_737670 [Bisporella sp. PMI_857]